MHGTVTSQKRLVNDHEPRWQLRSAFLTGWPLIRESNYNAADFVDTGRRRPRWMKEKEGESPKCWESAFHTASHAGKCHGGAQVKENGPGELQLFSYCVTSLNAIRDNSEINYLSGTTSRVSYFCSNSIRNDNDPVLFSSFIKIHARYVQRALCKEQQLYEFFEEAWEFFTANKSIRVRCAWLRVDTVNNITRLSKP